MEGRDHLVNPWHVELTSISNSGRQRSPCQSLVCGTDLNQQWWKAEITFVYPWCVELTSVSNIEGRDYLVNPWCVELTSISNTEGGDYLVNLWCSEVKTHSRRQS